MPHIGRYCDTIAAIPHIARFFLREVRGSPQCDTPPGNLIAHRHICTIPHFATYRAIIVRYLIKQVRKCLRHYPKGPCHSKKTMQIVNSQCVVEFHYRIGIYYRDPPLCGHHFPWFYRQLSSQRSVHSIVDLGGHSKNTTQSKCTSA